MSAVVLGNAASESFDPLLSSLATCAGLYVLVSCRSRGIPTGNLRLEQHSIVENGKPSRVSLRVLLPPGFPESQAAAVRRAAAGAATGMGVANAPFELLDVQVTASDT